MNGVYNLEGLHSFFGGLSAAIAAVLADPRGQFGTGLTGRAGRGLPHLADAGATGGQGARRDLDLVPDHREGARPRDQRGGGDLPRLPARHGLRRGGLGGHRHRPAARALGLLPDDCTPPSWRVSRAIREPGLAIFERPLPPGRQGTATADAIVVSASIPDSRNRLATLLHEYAHVLAHFGPVAREKDERQCELEAESACYVVLAHLGIDYPFSRDYLLHYQVTPDLC